MWCQTDKCSLVRWVAAFSESGTRPQVTEWRDGSQELFLDGFIVASRTGYQSRFRPRAANPPRKSGERPLPDCVPASLQLTVPETGEQVEGFRKANPESRSSKPSNLKRYRHVQSDVVASPRRKADAQTRPARRPQPGVRAKRNIPLPPRARVQKYRQAKVEQITQRPAKRLLGPQHERPSAARRETLRHRSLAHPQARQA